MADASISGDDLSVTWASLLEAAAEIIWSLAQHDVKPGSAELVVAQVMRVRASRLLRACVILVRSGYTGESAGLVRSIWEDAVSVAYMAESPSARSGKWVAFAEKRRAHHIEWALSRPEGLYPEVVSKLKDAAVGLQASSDPWWSGLGPSAMVSKLMTSEDQASVMFARDFTSMYQTLCDDAHGSPFAIDHLLTLGGVSATTTVGPNDDRLDMLPGLAVYGALQLGRAIARLGADIDVVSLQGLVEEAYRLVKQANP